MSSACNVQTIARTVSSNQAPSFSCADCMLRGNCFPIDMGTPNVSDFNALVQRTRPLHKGDHIYRIEQPFAAIYAVRSGAFKAYTVSSDGEEQVAQLYLPGEIFGMDGLSRNRHAVSVVALETSSVCVIPFERLQALSMRTASLQRHFFRLMSEVINREQDLITQLSKHSAERRIAAFLQRLSQHQAGRGQSASRVHLPLSRTEIGCHLGLTVETVSRIFSRLQKMGMLATDNREVEIMNLDGLRALAAGKVPTTAAQTVNFPQRRSAGTAGQRRPVIRVAAQALAV